MKKGLLLLGLLTLALPVWPSFFVEGVLTDTCPQPHIDTVFVVNRTDGGRLAYSDTAAFRYRWTAYDQEENTLVLKEESLPVDTTWVALQDSGSQGYLLEVLADDGVVRKWAWVFDYSRHPAVIDSVSVDTDVSDRCYFVQLHFDIDADTLAYDTIGHAQRDFILERTFFLTYDSTYWGTGSYQTETVVRRVGQVDDYSIESPLGSTTYTLSGDHSARTFQVESSFTSDPFEAIAVEIHPDARVSEREAQNEKDRNASSNLKLSGSAPLVVEILSHASDAAFFYDWTLSTEKDFSNTILKYNDPDFRYTFNEKETYYLRLQVANSLLSEDTLVTCQREQVYVVEVMESMLDVPNIFTPNGDGMNDQFKVAYRSITDFHGVVYNVWGRKVYEWTDPADGWDGTIHGKPAAEGAYFYVIKATGNDKDEDGKVIEYFLRGDINLIR